MENYIEQCKEVRKLTMAPMKDISAAVQETKGDVKAAIQLLIKRNETSAADMANRRADNSIVYSYVHSNKIGAMIILACQTDFVARNEAFLQLAKDICMHIVSAPNIPAWVSQETLPTDLYEEWKCEFEREFADGKKPPQVVSKIVAGKLAKRVTELCLMNQPFVKDDKTTVQQLLNKVSATVGEKVELKKFTRFSA